jgi:hypothetical protein
MSFCAELNDTAVLKSKGHHTTVRAIRKTQLREFICPREYVISARKVVPRGRMKPQYRHQTSPPNLPTLESVSSHGGIKMAKSNERTHMEALDIADFVAIFGLSRFCAEKFGDR